MLLLLKLSMISIEMRKTNVQQLYDSSMGIKSGEYGGKYAITPPESLEIGDPHCIYWVTYLHCVQDQREHHYGGSDNCQAQESNIHPAMDSSEAAEAEY